MHASFPVEARLYLASLHLFTPEITLKQLASLLEY